MSTDSLRTALRRSGISLRLVARLVEDDRHQRPSFVWSSHGGAHRTRSPGLSADHVAFVEALKDVEHGLNGVRGVDRVARHFGAIVARWREALAIADPSGTAPASSPAAPGRGFATLEDIARIVSGQPWLWRGWLGAGVLNAVAAEPGTGKTRFAMDLARRLWHGLAWPDGQAGTLPSGTRTLWVQGDRNFAEMLQLAHDFGLPREAVALNGSPDDPTGGLDLDDPETLATLADRIEETSPGFVVIDTVGMTTGRNLCRPEEAREYFAPLIDLAGRSGVAFLGQTHLSKDKEALGRRIVEKARVVVKMTQPDPEGQPDRRRLWVDKSAVGKPAPLGVSMGDSGNDYDFTPPVPPDPTPRKPGPAATKLDECKRWLADRLTPNPGAVQDLRDAAETAGFPAGTLYRAQRELGVAEYLVGRRKWWRLSEDPADDAPDLEGDLAF